jgi:hypothetical protein
MNAELLNALLPVALVFTGVLASLTRLIKKETFDRIPDLLFQICYPCIILQTIGKTNITGILGENAFAATLALAVSLASLLLGLTAAHWMRDDPKRPVTAFAMMINNSTYIGLPVAQLLFGIRGVTFIIVYGIIQDLFIWTVGLRMFSKHVNPSLRGMFLNPAMISLAVALLLSLAGAPDLPLLDDVMQTFGAMTIPLALIYLGYVLAGDAAAVLRARGWVLSLSALKLMAIPAAAALIVLRLPIDGFYKSMAILMSGLPMPLMAVMLSKQFGKDTDFAVQLLIFSTALYIPVFAVLYYLQAFSIL